jgi:hypothetical protein
MATTTGAPAAHRADSAVEERGNGWVAFAGVMISVVGIMNVIYGIAAISNSRFYFSDTTYILSDLNTFGWVALVAGVTQLFAAFGIFARANWARWVGIITASVNMVIQLVWISAYPLASIALLAIDVLIVYALVAYGKNSSAAF